MVVDHLALFRDSPAPNSKKKTWAICHSPPFSSLAPGLRSIPAMWALLMELLCLGAGIHWKVNLGVQLDSSDWSLGVPRATQPLDVHMMLIDKSWRIFFLDYGGRIFVRELSIAQPNCIALPGFPQICLHIQARCLQVILSGHRTGIPQSPR